METFLKESMDEVLEKVEEMKKWDIDPPPEEAPAVESTDRKRPQSTSDSTEQPRKRVKVER
jgi:hypothetical protein